MKKFYFSLVAMMMVAFSNTISAAEDFWYNGIAYKILNEALHTVEATTPSSGYTELGGPITIPANVYNNNKTYVVTQIGANAFQNCKAITSVTFAKTLITINLRAFYGCENLAEIKFAPNGESALETIYSQAFYKTAVTTVTIPNGVKTLGPNVFEECKKLTTASLPNSLTYCDVSIFQNCTSLKTVNIPTSLEGIPTYFCNNCTSLKSITIPSNIKTIGPGAFRYTSLTSITIPNNVTKIGSEAFRGCTGLTTVTVPSTVVETQNTPDGSHRGIFRDCTGLISANIQNNTIWLNEFNGCTSLKTVTIGRNLINFYHRDNNEPFDGCPIETLTIGSNVAADIALYPSASSTLKTLTLNDGVTDLPENAFKGCSALTTVTLPNGLQSIGNSAFQNCTRMYDLIAKMPRPFAIDASVFSGVQQHGYCDLHVPQGSKFRYEAMEVWKEFTAITEDAGTGVKKGDVNGDGNVTIADVVAVLNLMAEQ